MLPLRASREGSVIVRVLPIWQPWASLIAVGAKRVETRHWAAPPDLIGQRIAIYATKKKTNLPLVVTSPFADRLVGELGRLDGNLPLGAIVATAVLDRCSEMTSKSITALADRDPHEYFFGFYDPGRFAWVLRGVDHLTEAVPFTWSRGPQAFDDIRSELVTRL